MAKKRTNGEGNIRKRKDGRWEGRCTAGYDQTGKWFELYAKPNIRPSTAGYYQRAMEESTIPQDAVDFLVQERTKHPDNPWMFPSSRTGGIYHPDSVTTLHQRILKDAGLERLRFHDLCHTFATLALQNGVDIKTVSTMPGHYDAGSTLRTYTHTTGQKQDEGASRREQQIDKVMEQRSGRHPKWDGGRFFHRRLANSSMRAKNLG